MEAARLMDGVCNPDDWITIWQSELAARAVDREAHELVARYAQTWTSLAHDAARHDGPAGRAGPDAAAGPAAAGAASDALREGLEQLRRQLEAYSSFPPDGA